MWERLGLTQSRFLGKTMPEFIEQDVRAMRGDSSSEHTTLLVGSEGGSAREELRDNIEAIGGEVLDSIGRSSLRVSIPVSEVDELCEIEHALSVERDKDDVYPQNQGNL